MEKVVLDTNVYISAILVGKTCEEILQHARDGRYEIAVSPAILEELSNVLGRKFGWSGQQVATVLEDLKTFTRWVHPRKRLRVITMDEPDNRILECAVAAKASCVVTGDSHLLQLQSYRKIPILSPAQFLQSLREG
ncbi:MAG: putative toxin-antitoxin system toxin component, PIN family [Nitrospirota bacterium]